MMKELEELKKKYEELGKEIERLEKQQINKRWRADFEKDYFYVDEGGTVVSVYEDGDLTDEYRYKIRNYFRMPEEARERLDNIITYYSLMDLAEELNKGREIDWENGMQIKYYIYYDFMDNKLSSCSSNYSQSLGQIYCLDGSLLDQALKRIGKEKLEKLFKRGIVNG